MRIAVIGGGGAMARAIVQDLSENPKVEEILVADYQEEKAKFLASLGLASKDPIEVQGTEVVPLEVLTAVVDKQMKDKLGDATLRINDMECLHARVIGKKSGRKVEYIVDCIAKTHSRWGFSCGDVSTGVPPSIVAQMQVEGMIRPGVWGPEQVIDPEYFFKELAKREMQIEATKKWDLAAV